MRGDRDIVERVEIRNIVDKEKIKRNIYLQKNKAKYLFVNLTLFHFTSFQYRTSLKRSLVCPENMFLANIATFSFTGETYQQPIYNFRLHFHFLTGEPMK